jgi:hypothetical protein
MLKEETDQLSATSFPWRCTINCLKEPAFVLVAVGALIVDDTYEEVTIKTANNAMKGKVFIRVILDNKSKWPECNLKE